MDTRHFSCREIEGLNLVCASASLEHYDWGNADQWRLLKEEWNEIVSATHGPIVLDTRGLRINGPKLSMFWQFSKILASCDRKMAVVCSPIDNNIFEVTRSHVCFRWWNNLETAIFDLNSS